MGSTGTREESESSCSGAVMNDNCSLGLQQLGKLGQWDCPQSRLTTGSCQGIFLLLYFAYFVCLCVCAPMCVCMHMCVHAFVCSCTHVCMCCMYVDMRACVLYVCRCVCCVCNRAFVEVRGQLVGLVLFFFFYLVGSRNGTEATRLDSRHLCLRSHFISLARVS